MSQERWKRIALIFEAGMEMPPRARAEYWKRECGADREMLAELENLLNGHQQAEEVEFMEGAGWSLKAQDENTRKDEMIGKKIGHCVIKARIGGGGMGDVYLAEERKEHFKREVVVKIVKDELGRNEHVRFQHEMRILAQLEHDNIARMYDAGNEDGRLYLIMEYLRDGVSLREFLTDAEKGSRKKLPPDQSLEITKQICAGFSAAHEKGIVHRDVKPENIMIIQSNEGLRVKVIDFGIAIPSGAAENPSMPTILSTRGLIGTPQYMSPEQAEGRTREEIDRRSDIYSVGLILYEMLTGRAAFEGSIRQILQQQVESYPPAPRRLNPELSEAVNRVVMKAISKPPSERQQRMSELARELEQAVRSLPDSKDETTSKFDRRKLVAGASALVLMLSGWLGYNHLIATTPPQPSNVISPTPSPSIPPTPSPEPIAEERLIISLYQQNQGGQPKLVSSETTFRNTAREAKTGGLRVAIDAARRGYIYILEQADAGKVNILYPDRRNPAGFRPVAPGEKVFVPNADGWLRFRGEPGTDVVYILFANDKGDPLFEPVEAALKRKESSLDPKSGSELLVALQRRADEFAANASGNSQDLQQTVKGAGALVGVLKLKHQQ